MTTVFFVWQLAIGGLAGAAWLEAVRRESNSLMGVAWGAFLALFLFILLAAVGQAIGAPIG